MKITLKSLDKRFVFLLGEAANLLALLIGPLDKAVGVGTNYFVFLLVDHYFQ